MRGKAILIAGGIFLLACPKRIESKETSTSAKKSFPLRTVEIAEPPASLAALGMTREKIRRRFTTRSKNADWITLGAEKGYNLRIEVVNLRAAAPTIGGRAPSAVMIAIIARPHAQADSELRAHTIVALSSLSTDDADKRRSASIEKRVWDGFDHVAKRWLSQAKLTVISDQDLLRELHVADPQHLADAIVHAGNRRLRPALDRLMELVQDRRPIIWESAVGALLSIGDRRAVKALTALADFRNDRLMAQLIDAVGTLGGKEADAFLELLADGHPSPLIRQMSSRALLSLRKQPMNQRDNAQ